MYLPGQPDTFTSNAYRRKKLVLAAALFIFHCKKLTHYKKSKTFSFNTGFFGNKVKY